MRWGLALIALLVLTGCSQIQSALQEAPLPTPLSRDYIPTAVALTLAAAQPPAVTQAEPPASPAPPQSTLTPELEASPTASATPQPSDTPQASPTGPTSTPYTLAPSPTYTPTPELPNAEIEIRNLGALSRVTSPLHVYQYLKPGAGGRVRIELFGEDGRIIYREIRKINFVPTGAWAVFTVDIDFEIAATAEVGRLKISVDDDYGRTVALNSVPLILLSVGDADIVPPQDVLAPIVIRQPRRKALIQGGTLLVSGMVRPESEKPLIVKLVTAQGGEVGFRLAEVSSQGTGAHKEFAVEVPYQVSEPTSALLIVFEAGANLSDVIHLSSLEVLLSP